MEPILLASVVAIIISVIIVVIFFRKPQEESLPDVQQQPRPPERQRNVPRRIQGNRNVRQRNRGIAPEPSDDDEEEEDESQNATPDIELPNKVGAKKRAKLEAKAEKKAQREFDERLREERKRTQEQNEAERQKEEERATLERKQQEEAERHAREEKERQEHEEYLKMKAAFSVEEEGFDEGENESENENLLQEFVNYVKSAKTVVMGDLAAKFKLKTQSVIARIEDLLNDGTLTGVLDDRGKFIYVSETEMKAIVKFINQHGRLTVAELVENGDRLVHLKPSEELKT